MDEIQNPIIYLSILCDCVGFNNGVYKYNFFSKSYDVQLSNEIFFDFIYSGGFSFHPEKYETSKSINRNVSDTFSEKTYQLQLSLDVIKDKQSLSSSSYVSYFKDLLLSFFVKETNPEFKKNKIQSIHGYSPSFIHSINKLMKKEDYLTFPYEQRYTENTTISRVIPLAFIFSESDIKDIIEYSVELTCLTNNNAIAYLSNICIVLCLIYGINKITPFEWIFKILDFLENNKNIDKYIQKTRIKDYELYLSDKFYFINKIKNYIDKRFDDSKNLIQFYHLKYPSQRSEFYKKFIVQNIKELNIGLRSDDCFLISYDCFIDSIMSLDSKKFTSYFESMALYSSFHVGDCNSTGFLSGAFYGSYFGFENVNKELIERIKEYIIH